jgi:metacaspase-1
MSLFSSRGSAVELIMAKGISLHIGLNSVDPKHYAGWDGVLKACEADADDMASVAKAAGFSSTQLLTQKATRDAVIASIKAAAKKLKAGDIFFLTYSGHGGQVPDRNGDEQDLEDETWCLFDGELIDDELWELWAGFEKDVRVLVLSDSCHSGTVVRAAYDELTRAGVTRKPVSRAHGGADPVFRAMPDDVALRTYRVNQKFYDKVQDALPEKPSDVAACVRLISGCQDNQLSQDGAFNGLFTGTLLRVWNNGKFAGAYNDFHREIVKRMPPTQSPNQLLVGGHSSVFDGQKPFSI